ncbi:MAG: dUTP diphosphatase [Gammaproteobacteria bacterium]|nr:dUTP diphosphatase [Gammaproteobacteria bacterium]
MLLKDQASIMLSLQASMNAKVDPDWVSSRYPYLRAVVVEGAEAIDHHGWKWWKKQEKDLPQLQMELIDIWHFVMSEILLANNADHDSSLHALMGMLGSAKAQNLIAFDGRQYVIAELDLITKFELLIALAVSRRIELALFSAIMSDCELDWEALYCQYVGKNVLNMFRQDKGYKAGTYQKIWNGREDNEYLVEIIESLDSSRLEFKDEVYAALEAAYPSE